MLAKTPITYQPKITVTLYKVIRYKNGEAQRWVADRNIIDLTAFLGDAGGVTTTKDVRQQAGAFTITFADKMDQKTQDSMYALVSPMDYIEIRMTRSGYKYASAEIPVTMRGFVSSVKRNQEMGDDGKPRRFVTITGMDFGKLMGMIQVFYEQNYGLGQDLLTVFQLFSNYALGGTAARPQEFIQAVLDKVINPFLDTLYHKSAITLPSTIEFEILADAASVKSGTVQPYTFQAYQGDIWGLLRGFADLYWNEMFIQDRDDGVYLVYRPLPFKDISGNFIGDAVDPGTTTITPADIKSMNLERSDKGVANYFWTNAPQFQLIDQGTLQMDAFNRSQDYFVRDRPNCDPALYGIRKMQADTQQGPTDARNSGAHLSTTDQNKANTERYAWVDERREGLKLINQDNVVFEEGELVIKGNEAIKPGTYVAVDYGVYRADYYVFAVTHDFQVLQSYTTRLQVTRGTGFLARNSVSGSPYIAERTIYIPPTL